MHTNGDLESYTASLTGPDPAFELDFSLVLSPFAPPGPKGPEQLEFKTPETWLDAASLWTIGVAPKVQGALEAAKSAKGGRAVVLQTRQLAADRADKEGATFGDFEKANVAMHILKLSRTGIHYMINKQRAQSSWAPLVGHPMVVALLVVLALGACRSFLSQKKGYVAPEEQDE